MSQQVLTFAGSPLSGAAMIAALESKLQSLASNRSGTSRPSDIVTGEIWLDTTTSTAQLLKFWDGADDITIATINATTNAITFIGALRVDQNLSDLANVATARTNLGLEIGADVQAYDGDTCISDTVKTYTAQHYPTPLAISSSSGALAVDCDTCALATSTLTENTTVGSATHQARGKLVELEITGASSYTLSWNTNWKATDLVALPSAPAAGKKLWVVAESNGTYMYLRSAIKEV